MKTLPRLLCAVSLAAAAVGCGRIARARDADDALAALRRHLDNDRSFFEAAVRVAASPEERPAVREAALRSVVRVAAETGDWLEMEGLCRSVLASQRTPERLLRVCADGLARALRMFVGHRHAADELEELAQNLPEPARPTVMAALGVMRKPVRSELDSRVAQRLPAPLVPRPSELLADVATRFPGPVETSVEKIRAGRMLGWVERTLSANLLQEARALEEGKDLAGARDRYAQYLSLFRSGGGASAGLEGLWRTFTAEPDAREPIQIAEHFTRWARERLRDAETLEAAEFFVCRQLYRDEAYEAALRAVAGFRERCPGSALIPRADLLEGLVFVRTGNKDEAIAAFKRLSEQYKEDADVAPRALLLIAWTYVFDGEYEKARPALQAVARDYPETDHAEKARALLGSLAQKEPAQEKPKQEETGGEDLQF